MKIYRMLYYLIPSLILILLVLTAVDRLVAGVSFTDFVFFQSKKYSAYTVADEIGDLYLLNTSEYRMKMIFPFDFVEKDYNWRAVKRLYDEGYRSNDEMSGELALYGACIDAGFDPAIDIYDFIVLTAIVKAGINIGENLESVITIKSIDQSKKIISLRIPEVEITDYYIEDRKPDDDNFPDARLTPGKWRDLVIFLNPLIHDKIIHLGILENAGENSRELIEKILKEGGFAEVYFTGQDL